MATYLLTWNPKKWHWWGDNLEDDFKKDGDLYFGSWSCGNSKSIHQDDRVFLIRLGKEPRGIVASGWADSDVYEGKHWDDELAASGKTTLYIGIRLDTLLDAGSESILPRENLNRGILGKMHWDSQLSGVRIPDDVAVQLEDEWTDFLGNERQLIPVAEPSAIEGLLTETVRYVRGRSRQLRDLALRNSGGVCCICDIDYRRILDGKGVRVLQVHHRKQLAAMDSPRVTALSDLAVVCANCHMLIHMNPKQALSIEDLRQMLGKD
jgi:5-methylcytosine-specific restriction protein A